MIIHEKIIMRIILVLAPEYEVDVTTSNGVMPHFT